MMECFKRDYSGRSLVSDSHRVKNLTVDTVRKVVKEAMDRQSELLEKMTYTYLDAKKQPITDVTKIGGQKNNAKAIEARSIALEKTYGTGFKQLGWEGKGFSIQFKTNPSSMSTLRTQLLKGGLTGTQKGILGRPLLALFSEQDAKGGHAMAICFAMQFNKKGQIGVIFFDPNLGELFYNSKESAFGAKAKLGVFPFVEKHYGPVELYFLDFYSPLGA